MQNKVFDKTETNIFDFWYIGRGIQGQESEIRINDYCVGTQQILNSNVRYFSLYAENILTHEIV